MFGCANYRPVVMRIDPVRRPLLTASQLFIFFSTFSFYSHFTFSFPFMSLLFLFVLCICRLMSPILFSITRQQLSTEAHISFAQKKPSFIGYCEIPNNLLSFCKLNNLLINIRKSSFSFSMHDYKIIATCHAHFQFRA